MAQVFISYSRKDQSYARSLAEDLNTRDFEVWIDDRIDFGNRWWQTIVQAIRNSAALIVIMTPDSEKSEWVERELLLAQRENKPIFPLLRHGQEFPLLITTQHVDVSNGQLPPEEFYHRLRGLVLKGPDAEVPTSFSPSPAIRLEDPQRELQLEILSVLFDALKMGGSGRIPKSELIERFRDASIDGEIEILRRKELIEETSEKFGKRSYFYLEIKKAGIQFLEDNRSG